MGIFTLNQWTGITFLAISFAVSIIGIHRAVDVSLAPVSGLLILTWTRRIISLHEVIGILEILSITCLITKTPHNDTGVILQHINVMALTLNVHIVETRILTQRFLAITHSVALNVCLCCHIDTIFITQLIPTWVIGIVRSTHSIHVQLLHYLNVLNHAVNTHHIATIRVEFVTVHTLDEDGLTIHEQLLVFDFHLTEANALRDTFQELAAIIQGDAEIVEVRSLGCPLLRIGYENLGCPYPILLDGKVTHLQRSDIFARWVEKLNFIGLASSGRSCQLDGELTILVVVSQIGRDEHIVNVCLWTCIQITLTCNATETPEVLVFIP